MRTPITQYRSGKDLSATSTLIWQIVQFLVWAVGAFIFICLIFFPSTGLLLFWNILIPVAPALIVVAVGLWRNICPLATTTLLPRKLGLSQKKILSAKQLAQLNLISVILLYAIVPLRHALFNNNGIATAILITIMALTGFIMSLFFEWKSAWCSSLCPVHPVEKMYGNNISTSLPNAHCKECMNCVVPCPDSTPNIHPLSSQKTSYHRISGALIVGGLPGFIWGWFHVPDSATLTSFQQIISVYTMPLAGMIVSLMIYLLLSRSSSVTPRKLIAVFAFAAVSCYYWYRIPALLGFGEFANDGLLIDLSHRLPSWSVGFILAAEVLFFFWWLVLRDPNNKSWVIRPAYGKLQHEK